MFNKNKELNKINNDIKFKKKLKIKELKLKLCNTKINQN